MAIVLICMAAFLALALGYWVFMSSYSQVFGTYPYKGQRKDKVIALTFDDGPNEPYTSEIIDYLNAKSIKATFFIVGKRAQAYPDSVKKIIQSGHVVGNHSLSHEFHKYFIDISFAEEVQANQKILKELTGKTPALFRSPWLWRHPLIFKTLRNSNLQPVSGTFCYSFEVFQPSAQKISKHALKHAKAGSILIFHDGVEGKGGNRQQTAKAVKIVVDQLLNEGYEFVTVDKLLKVPAYQ